MIRVLGRPMLIGKLFLMGGELLLLILSAILASVLRLGLELGFEYLSVHWMLFLVQLLIYMICFYMAGLYDSVRDFKKLENILYLLGTCLVAMVLSIFFFYTNLTYIGRGIFLIYGGLSFTLALSFRVLYMMESSSQVWERRVLIIGAGSSGESLLRAIDQYLNSGLRVFGFIDDDPEKQGRSIGGVKVIGTGKDMMKLVDELDIDMLVVSITNKKNEELVKLLLKCHYNDVTVTDMFSVYEGVTGKLPVNLINSEWLLVSAMSKQRLVYGKVKRLVDIVCSLVILTVTLPVLAIAALAIWLETGRPLLYNQERLGQDYKSFNIIKFRTMVQDAEKECGAVWSSSCDTRVTRVGRVLRKLRVDELPQLYNVLRGDMSFVGPRPEREVFVKELEKEMPSYGHRLVVKPGLTGWAQVMQGYAASVDESREKLRYDLYYVKNMSLMLDLLIILRTIKVVLLFKGH